jgi:hypothetical protein
VALEVRQPSGPGPAREAAECGRGMGHIRVACNACHNQLRATVFYEPRRSLWVLRLYRDRLVLSCHTSGADTPRKWDIMRLHPLQRPLDNLIGYMNDAQSIYNVVVERTQKLAKERREGGSSSGAGAPPASHASLNRAVVLATVGAWEAFCEDLAETAQREDSRAQPPCAWYQIAGSGGIVQTPNSGNVRKLFWTFFRYDPVKDWRLEVWASERELGTGATRWRDKPKTYEDDEAAKFLDTMVKARHGFAHQDPTQFRALPGISEKGSGGRIGIGQHHALNSLSVLVQLAILTTRGLSHVLELNQTFRWSRQMDEAEWAYLLIATTAGERVAAEWTNAPPL